jgi:integrase
MRATERLTALKIESRPPGDHGDGNGLWLHVRPSGARSWGFIYRWEGKQPELGLGSWPSVTLAAARKKAAEGRRLLNETPPRNPKEVWKQARASGVPIFTVVAKKYLEGKSKQWRSPRHRAQVEANLLRHCELIAGKPVDKITTEDVLAVLATQTPSMAHRLRSDIARVLGAAKALGHIPPAVQNAAEWRNHLSTLMAKPPEQTPHRAMPFVDVPAFMEQLREQRRDAEGKVNVVAYGLEFAILCGNRSGEARLARWDEFDAEDYWNIPAGRMKAFKPHVVPLSPGARAILDVMRTIRTSEYVFPGSRPGKPLTGKSFERLLKRMGCKFVAHGFRSSFRNWIHVATNTPNEIGEIAISHGGGGKVELRYRRDKPLEKLRRLFQDWDDYCAPKDNVRQFPVQRAG